MAIDRSIRTSQNKARFLSALAGSGNATACSRELGISKTQTYEWRRTDPAFASGWEEALSLGIDALEDECRRRAFAGSDLLMIFLLKAHRPHLYRERQTIDLNSRFIGPDLRAMQTEELRQALADLRRTQDGPLLIQAGEAA